MKLCFFKKKKIIGSWCSQRNGKDYYESLPRFLHIRRKKGTKLKLLLMNTIMFNS